MKIELSPIRLDETVAIERRGDTLIVDGIEFDLRSIPEGGTLPREAVDCRWLASDIERTDGQITLRLLSPHGSDASEAERFPPLLILSDGQKCLLGRKSEDRA